MIHIRGQVYLAPSLNGWWYAHNARTHVTGYGRTPGRALADYARAIGARAALHQAEHRP